MQWKVIIFGASFLKGRIYVVSKVPRENLHLYQVGFDILLKIVAGHQFRFTMSIIFLAQIQQSVH